MLSNHIKVRQLRTILFPFQFAIRSINNIMEIGARQKLNIKTMCPRSFKIKYIHSSYNISAPITLRFSGLNINTMHILNCTNIMT